MTVSTMTYGAPMPDMRRMWRDAHGFATLAVLLVLALVPLYAAMALDGRVFMGQSPWVKPIKFHYALSLYLFSLAFFARYLTPALRQSRLWRVFAGAVCLAVLGEVMWLTARPR
ncbi:MAG: hypothetical protein HC779_01135 [Phyllobacteriaceae bacterium]|nr:hypothetical protein [Phyllobacteriaceae bacterium]